MAKDREVRLRAQKKYDEAHRGDYKTYLLKCNRADDADVIEYLDAQPNKAGLIKELIRERIKGGQ